MQDQSTPAPAAQALLWHTFPEAGTLVLSDFPQSGYNVHRLSRDVTQLLLHSASLARLRSEPSANEGRQSGTGNLLRIECSRNLNSQATLNAIMIDAGIDAAASLWGVRLGRKFTKTAPLRRSWE